MNDNDKDIIDLDNLPKTEGNSFTNILDKFYASLPDVSSPIKNFDYDKMFEPKDGELSYNDDRGILKIKGESVKFTLDKKMANMLKALFSGDIKKEWSWDEIIESWGESIEDYGSKYQAAEQIYNIGKNINKRVAADTSNKNFLVATRKITKINPKYIK
jgi:hypothetical protein